MSAEQFEWIIDRIKRSDWNFKIYNFPKDLFFKLLMSVNPGHTPLNAKKAFVSFTLNRFQIDDEDVWLKFDTDRPPHRSSLRSEDLIVYVENNVETLVKAKQIMIEFFKNLLDEENPNFYIMK
jgi:hypothetical protein